MTCSAAGKTDLLNSGSQFIMPDSHIAVPAIWLGTFQSTTVKPSRTIRANSRAIKRNIVFAYYIFFDNISIKLLKLGNFLILNSKYSNIPTTN